MAVQPLQEIQLTPVACCTPVAAPEITDDAGAGPWPTSSRRSADPHRVRIVNLLANAAEPVCVCDFMPQLGLSQGTVSFHLKKLLEAGLLDREQRGTWAYYSLNRARARASGATCSTSKEAMHDDDTELREEVRRRYAEAATSRCSAGAGAACDCSHPGTTLRRGGPRVRPRAVRGARARRPARRAPCSPAWAAATRPPSPTSTRARPCSTSARAAGSTSCCRPGASARPARCTAST